MWTGEFDNLLDSLRTNFVMQLKVFNLLLTVLALKLCVDSHVVPECLVSPE